MSYKILDITDGEIYAENIPTLKLARRMAVALEDVVVLDSENKMCFTNERKELPIPQLRPGMRYDMMGNEVRDPNAPPKYDMMGNEI